MTKGLTCSLRCRLVSLVLFGVDRSLLRAREPPRWKQLELECHDL